MFMQKALQIPPLQAGLVFLPLALTFVIASRHSGVRAKHRGTLVLIEGCAVQIVRPCGTGDGDRMDRYAVRDGSGAGADDLRLRPGLVMAPLSSAVLSTVKPCERWRGSGMYGTTAQIANAAGVAAIGAVYFAIEANQPARPALFAACALFCVVDCRLRRISDMDAARDRRMTN